MVAASTVRRTPLPHAAAGRSVDRAGSGTAEAGSIRAPHRRLPVHGSARSAGRMPGDRPAGRAGVTRSCRSGGGSGRAGDPLVFLVPPPATRALLPPAAAAGFFPLEHAVQSSHMDDIALDRAL